MLLMVNTSRLDWNGRGIDHVNLNSTALLILQCFQTVAVSNIVNRNKSIQRALCEAVEKS